MVTRSIESAQRKVEARNFDIRKQLLEYDDVANDQRREIYRLRNDILETDDTGEMVTNLRTGYFTDMFRAHVPDESVEEQDVAGLEAAFGQRLATQRPAQSRAGVERFANRRGLAGKGAKGSGRVVRSQGGDCWP